MVDNLDDINKINVYMARWSKLNCYRSYKNVHMRKIRTRCFIELSLQTLLSSILRSGRKQTRVCHGNWLHVLWQVLWINAIRFRLDTGLFPDFLLGWQSGVSRHLSECHKTGLSCISSGSTHQFPILKLPYHRVALSNSQTRCLGSRCMYLENRNNVVTMLWHFMGCMIS